KIVTQATILVDILGPRRWDVLARRLQLQSGSRCLRLSSRQGADLYRHPRERWSDAALSRLQICCDTCELKPRCCPKMPARKVPRSIYENARDVACGIAKTETYVTSRRERKKIEMLFANLKRILRLDRLRPKGPSGARDEFLLAATVQNLRKLAKLIPLPTPQPA